MPSSNTADTSLLETLKKRQEITADPEKQLQNDPRAAPKFKLNMNKNTSHSEKKGGVNIADSNIANLGTDLEKKVRQAASQGEPAWKGAGKKVGIQIWRIEKFKVIAWPREQYGSFFDGDSYIVLWTYAKEGQKALQYNIHFWLGQDSTQDEMGTAAYKTVELDDYLGGTPVQFREVQSYESDIFMSYFNNEIKILSGGIDSGFNQVKPEEYVPRLLHIKGSKKVRVVEVERSTKSMNSGDCFILDAGLKIWQWNGQKSSGPEKYKATQTARAIRDSRSARPELFVLQEYSAKTDPDADEFWELLGGKEGIKTQEEGGSDAEWEKDTHKILMRLHIDDNDDSKVDFFEVAKGHDIKPEMLETDDVFIFDNGNKIFAWVGKETNAAEKKNAMNYAQEYLKRYNRPVYLPIAKVWEGHEGDYFNSSF